MYPEWSLSPNVKLHPDNLVRVSDAEKQAYLDNPLTLIGKAFATQWDSEEEKFELVFLVWAIMDTGKEKYHVHVVPDYSGEAFYDTLSFLGTEHWRPVLYVVPV